MPKRVDHDERRRTITEALARIAARQGLAGVTMRQVAAEAGVSVGRVQHYFASKDELLLAALRGLAGRAAERVRRAVGALGPEATERDRIRATLVEFLPLDAERRAATVLFRAFHEGGVNDPGTTGREAAEVPRAFDATMIRSRPPVVFSRSRIAIVASTPSMTGIWMSIRTTSK